MDFVRAVQSLSPQVKILCTSRFLTTFQEYFSEYARLEISAQNEDIRAFAVSQIQKQFRLAKHVRAEPALKDRIIKKIIEESQGM